MARHIRIPFLIDVILVTAGSEILSANESRTLDRGFPSAGPILNRIIQRRIRKVLSNGIDPLPSAAPRDDPERSRHQLDLLARLETGPAPWRDTSVDALAEYVRRERTDPVGQLCQRAIGELFKDDYRAEARSWADARAMQNALTSVNPILLVWYAMMGRVARAQQRLNKAVSGDSSGLHATGIAVHSLVASIQRMRKIYESANKRRSMKAAEAATLAVIAPQSVLRQASTAGATVVGNVRQGTLVVFSLRKAAERNPDPRLIFMSDAWNFCPAHPVVPTLLATVWTRAVSQAKPGA